MTNKNIALAFGALIAALAISIHTGCSVDSADSVIRTVAINIGGVYRYDEGSCGGQGKFVSANSGRPVISFDLRQSGDTLEAIDNNGIIFRGTIGNVSDNAASVNLEGVTTVGSRVVFSGNVTVNGGRGIMQGTWIEESFFATLCGSSSGQSIITNTPPITPTNIPNLTVNNAESTMNLAAYQTLAWWLTEG